MARFTIIPAHKKKGKPVRQHIRRLKNGKKEKKELSLQNEDQIIKTSGKSPKRSQSKPTKVGDGTGFRGSEYGNVSPNIGEQYADIRGGKGDNRRRLDLLDREVEVVQIHNLSNAEIKGIKKIYPNAHIDKGMYELDNPKDFHELISGSKENNKFSASVEVKSIEEYSKYRLFVTPDGGSGLAITPGGDLVSGFSYGDKSKPRQIAQLLTLGVKEGATKADSFNTVLPGYYTKFGFKPVSRLKFNDEFAPSDWDFNTYKPYNNGRPDVVFYAWDGGKRSDIAMNLGSFGEPNDLIKVKRFEKANFDGAFNLREKAAKKLRKNGTNCIGIKGYIRKNGTKVEGYTKCDTKGTAKYSIN